MAASKRGRAARIAALERLIEPPPDPGRRAVLDDLWTVLAEFADKPGFCRAVGFTAADLERLTEFAGRGFSEAEVERAAKWFAVVFLLEDERKAEHRRLNTPGATPDPGEEAAHNQRIAGYQEAASEGARWLNCRREHRPGVCEPDCNGARRLPEPSPPVDVQAGQSRVDVAVDAELRAVWRAIDQQGAGGVPWGAAPAELRKARRGR